MPSPRASPTANMRVGLSISFPVSCCGRALRSSFLRFSDHATLSLCTGAEEGKAMAKIRHIALATNDPIKTAEFYKQAFDFKEVGRTGNPDDPGGIAWGIYLSDGTLNLAVLKFKNVDQLGKGLDYVGIHHFGVLID